MKTLLRMFAFVSLALPVLAADTVKDPTDFASEIAVPNKFEIDTVSSRMVLRTLNAAAKTPILKRQKARPRKPRARKKQPSRPKLASTRICVRRIAL